MAASSTTAIAQTPVLGDTTAKLPRQDIVIRHGHLSDFPIMAVHNKDAYRLNPVHQVLAPRAEEHPDDLVRFYLQGLQNRFVKPFVLTLVACIPAQKGGKEKVIGYGQFVRFGDDEGAKEFMRSKGGLHLLALWILSWWFYAWHSISNTIWPDRVSDMKAVKMFGAWMQEDRQKYWESYPERSNRWHAASLIVSPEYQGKGIGRLLMSEVIEKAQSERVVIGLTSSPHGEFLYRKLGFEMLGDFSHRLGNDEGGGGIMIRYPEGWEGQRHHEA